MSSKPSQNMPFAALFSVFLLVLLLLVAPNTLVQALQPPPPTEQSQIQSIKKKGDRASASERQTLQDYEERQKRAKELGNHRVDPYLLKRALSKAARKAMRAKGMSDGQLDQHYPIPTPPPSWQGMPTTGNVKMFVLLIDFNDYAHASTNAFVNNAVFGGGNGASGAQSPYESLQNYYDRASYSQIDFSAGTTLGWYRKNTDRSAIVQTTTGREDLIKEALDHFEAQGHDFSQYDNDGDGKMDYFAVVWTGPPGAWASFWWGYQTSFWDSSYTLDGKTLGKYSWQWEAYTPGNAFTPLVLIHETGHALGLPDYYDYDGSVGPDGGVGRLDMMDGNKGDHGCFSKWMLDWLTPTIVESGSQNITMRPTGTTRDCVAIWPGMATGDLFSEYFVVQNRHKVGNDNASNMPGNGVLAWHLDATLNAAGNNFTYNNSYTDRKLLRLMEADGLEEIEAGGSGDAGDYYSTGQVLGPASLPSTDQYDGTESGVKISNFSTSGTSVSAKFEIITDDLEVTPLAGLVSAGDAGGPFNPTSKQYTLMNKGGSAVGWRATPAEGWIGASPSLGTLAAGASTTLTLSISAAANSLTQGDYSGSVAIENTTSGQLVVDMPVSLNITAPKPANDDFADAITLTGTSGATNGTNVGAGEQSGEPQHPSSAPLNSVWWKWTAPATGDMTFDSFGSDFDTTLAVYRGLALTSLELVASNDDAGGGRQSEATFAVIAGTTYAIAVDGYSASMGSITLNWSFSGSTPGILSVATTGGLSSTGEQGGPFWPFFKGYTVQNIGGALLRYSVDGNRPWIRAIGSGDGTLAAGATATITVSITSEAETLAAGDYTGAAIFTNSTDGAGNTARAVSLQITAPAGGGRGWGNRWSSRGGGGFMSSSHKSGWTR